jgi:hypothetical protein
MVETESLAFQISFLSWFYVLVWEYNMKVTSCFVKCSFGNNCSIDFLTRKPDSMLFPWHTCVKSKVVIHKMYNSQNMWQNCILSKVNGYLCYSGISFLPGSTSTHLTEPDLAFSGCTATKYRFLFQDAGWLEGYQCGADLLWGCFWYKMAWIQTCNDELWVQLAVNSTIWKHLFSFGYYTFKFQQTFQW